MIEDSRFVSTDPETVSWILSTLEYEVNYFFPGLEFAKLAEESNLKINIKKADRGTVYKGTYDDLDVMVRIWVRSGDNITPLMECMDRYNVLQHEVLHFIANRYLHYEYDSYTTDGEFQTASHNVEYFFKDWAFTNNFPYDYTVEGRLSTMIWRECYKRQQEALEQ